MDNNANDLIDKLLAENATLTALLQEVYARQIPHHPNCRVYDNQACSCLRGRIAALFGKHTAGPTLGELHAEEVKENT